MPDPINVLVTDDIVKARAAIAAAGSDDFLNAHNSGLNLLMDGDFSRDATWWGALGAGLELSTDVAHTGDQSLKITGNRTFYPNVTESGQVGAAVAKAEPGRLFRLSFRVWQPDDNTADGYIRGLIRAQGSDGFDVMGGAVINQSDMTAEEWTYYSWTVTLPVTGSNAPYLGCYPYIHTSGVDSADVLYVDSVRFEDVTDAPVELIAPPPTGDRDIDTANLQPLVSLAQTTRGTVILRAGTYAADLVTAKLNYQPRIIGQGKRLTKIDGTILMQGISGQFSGGWLEAFSFTGDHEGEAALELKGVCDVRWDNIRCEGTYDVGVLFHNELEEDYTELCCGAMGFYQTVTTAIEYRVGAGISSFHGSGLLEGSKIQTAGTAAAVKIGAGARPYNSPLSVGVWTQSTTQAIISHAGDAQANFFGNLNLEGSAGGVVVASGTDIYFAGSLNTYLASGTLSLGTCRLVVTVTGKPGGPVEFYQYATRTGTETLTNKTLTSPKISSIKGTGGASILNLTDSGTGGNYLEILNAQTGSGVAPQIKAQGADTNVPIWLVPKGTCVVGLYAFTGNTPTLQALGADANHDLALVAKGAGGIRNGSGSTAPGWYKGAGSPEGVVTAPPGSLYSNTSGGADTTLYAKETGTGNTGWSAMAGA